MAEMTQQLTEAIGKQDLEVNPGRLSTSGQEERKARRERKTHIYQIHDTLYKKVVCQTIDKQFGDASRAKEAAQILCDMYRLGCSKIDLQRISPAKFVAWLLAEEFLSTARRSHSCFIKTT